MSGNMMVPYVQQFLISFSYCLVGLSLIAFIGFITLHVFSISKYLSLRERFALSPVFFLPYILGLFCANIVMGGLLVSSFSALLMYLVGSLAMLAMVGRTELQASYAVFVAQKKRGEDTPERKLFWVSFSVVFIACILVSCWAVLIGTRISGDALNHLLWINHFLNGRMLSSVIPLQGTGMPGEMYPFLTHFAAAFLACLLQVPAEMALTIMTFFQAVLLPFGIFFLVQRVVGNSWAAIAAMILSCFYFGHSFYHGVWWFNLPVQRLIMPQHITRVLGWGMALFSLYLYHEIIEKDRKRLWLIAGVLTGVVGLVHPYPFVFLILFMGLAIVFRGIYTEWILVATLLKSIFIAIGIFSIMFLVPVFGVEQSTDIVTRYTQLPLLVPHGGRQVLFTVREYWLFYGLPGVWAVFVCSLFFKKKVNFFGLLVFTVILILVATWLKELLIVYFSTVFSYHPVQHKFGKGIFIVIVLLVTKSLYDFGRYRKQYRWMVGVICLVLLLVTVSTAPVFLSANNFCNRFDPNVSRYNDPLFLPNIIRQHIHKESVLAVPSWWSKRVASHTGIDVLYNSQNSLYTPYRFLANTLLYLTSEEQRKKIEQTVGYSFEMIVADVLATFDVDWLVVPSTMESFYNSLPFVVLKDTGYLSMAGKEKLFSLYHVVPQSFPSIDGFELGRLVLENPEVYRQATGVRPLLFERFIRLKTSNVRRKEIQSLALVGESLFGVFQGKQTIVEINKKNGKISDRFFLPEPPLAITGNSKELYVYLPGSRQIMRVVPTSGTMQNVGHLATSKLNIIDMTIDDKGIFWFLADKGISRQYTIFSYDLVIKEIRTTIQLPKKNKLFAIAFDNVNQSILFTGCKGSCQYIFELQIENKKVVPVMFNGRIRPRAFCLAEGEFFLYDRQSHLIAACSQAGKDCLICGSEEI